jgi:hypothetical protein
MTFTQGHAKTGGRKKGVRNRKTVAATPKTYAEALEHLAAVVAADEDQAITRELKVRAAIGLAAYQHSKPAPTRIETFVGPINYAAPKTPEEAQQTILDLGERLARREISIEAHDALIGGIRAYLGDKAAEQERRLCALEDRLREGGDFP